MIPTRTARRIRWSLVIGVVTVSIGSCQTAELREDHERWRPPALELTAEPSVTAAGTPTALTGGRADTVRPRDMEQRDIGMLWPDGADWTASATAPEAGSTLSEAAAWAHTLARNESLRSEWRRYQGSQFAQRQSAALKQLSARYQALSGRPEMRPAPQQPSAEELMSRVVAADLELARLRFEAAALDLQTQFRTRFHQARYHARNVAVLAENVTLSRRLVDVVRARYESGPLSTADLLRSQMRLDDAKRRLASERELRASAERSLGAMMVAGPIKPGKPESLSKAQTLDAVRASATNSLGIQKARAELRRVEAMTQLAERVTHPTLDVGTTQGRLPGSKFRAGYITGAPYLDELRQNLAATSRRFEEARIREPAAAQRARAELTDALRRVRTNRNSLVPKSRKALKATEAEYRVGRRNYLELDDVQRLWLDTSLAYRRAIRDAHIASAALARVLGNQGDRP